MNYLLINNGEIPDYIKYTFNSILSVDRDAKIYFCTNKPVKYKNIEVLDINNIISEETKNILEQYPDKINSLIKIFYLRDAQKKLDIQNFIHFENDVIIYKSFENIKSIFRDNRLNITKASNSKILFTQLTFWVMRGIHQS